MSFRVIQWATGGVGRAAMEGVLAASRSRARRGLGPQPGQGGNGPRGPAGPASPSGVTATSDVDALLATEADCVLYSPFMADPDVVAAILESGKNVVTPLGWFYPPSEEREKFDAIARAAGVTLHGTGIHPGGITERFPLMISALSGSITHVRAEEFSDIRTYGAPDVVRDWMLFGKTPEEARTQHHDRRARRRIPPVDLHGRRRAGLRHRSAAAHHPRDGGRHGADRLAHRPDPTGDGGGAAVHVGGHWSTANRWSPRRSTG